MTDASVSEIRAITPADLAAVLELNNLHARELSLLDAARLSHLVDQSYLALLAGEVDAFLIGFDQDADYDSPNYLWFRARYPRFAYVDRVAVAAHARGRGLARRFYRALFDKARAEGHSMIACEVNLDPPNPESDAFHAAMDFEEAGSAAIYGGERTVRYLVKRL